MILTLIVLRLRRWHHVTALRRCLTAIGALTVLLAAQQPGDAATGILGLDAAAIAVRAPASVYLDAVALAGSRVVAAGEHGVIIYSNDNGMHWTQASVPVDVTLTTIAFATPLDGWAAGSSGVILHTADGGKMWQLQLNGLQENQLTIAAAEAAVAQNSQAIGAPNAMRRANIFLQQGPARPFLCMLVQSAQSVTVFGAYRMTARTDDGGKTWTDWSLNIGDPLSHNLYGVAAVGADEYLAGEAGLVFRSTDGGAHFPAVTSPSDATLFGVIDTGDGVLVYGVAGEAFKSIDNGKSWNPVTVATSADLTAATTLKSGAILLASEAGQLFVSHDHGSSFRPLPKGLPMAVFDIKQTSDDGIVAVGNGGVLKLPPQFVAGN